MEATSETVARLHRANPDLHIIVLVYLQDGTIHPIVTKGAEYEIGSLRSRDIPTSKVTYNAARQIFEALRQERSVDYVLAITHQGSGSIAHSRPLHTLSAQRLSEALIKMLRTAKC